MTFHQHELLTDRIHGLGIKLHAPDGRDVGAAPVEIHPPVVVDEQVGIPEGKAAFDLLIRSVQNILRAVPVAVLLPTGGAEIHPIAHDPHIGGVVVQGKFPGQSVVFPMRQIVRHPHAQRHGGKDVIPAMKTDHGRVGGFPADLHLSVQPGIRIELIAVIDIDRITEIFHSCIHLLSPDVFRHPAE